MSKKTTEIYRLFNIATCISGTIYCGYEAINTPHKAITIISTLGVAYGTTWLFNRFTKSSTENELLIKNDSELLDDFMIYENK